MRWNEIENNDLTLFWKLQNFKNHPPIPLIDYCKRTDVSTFLHNLTELEISYQNETERTGPALEYPIFDDEPNTAFKFLILQFCTFGIAYYFRMIKTGKMFGRRVSRIRNIFLSQNDVK